MQTIKFTPKTRVVCDAVAAFHSEAVHASPHYIRTYAQLDCAEGEEIAAVRFASLGSPRFECGNSEASAVEISCHVPDTREVFEESCLGKRSCRVETEGMMMPGGEGCAAGVRLVAEVVCAAAH